MINKLYIFANTGKMHKLPVSGGQTSVRRIMAGFHEEGIDVVPIRRHRATLSSKFGHIVEVLYFAVFDLIKMVFKMLLGRRKNTAFMQVTFAGSLVPYELIRTCIAKCMGYKCVKYLQGGKMMDTLPNGSRLHKWMYRKDADWQEMILFEGMEALQLTRDITSTKLVYFPSYMVDEHIPTLCPQKPTDEWNIMYFGRMDRLKNVLVTIEAFNRVSAMLPHQKVRLTLIGGGHHKDYLRKIDEAIAESPYQAHIERYGLAPFDFIKEKMQSAHFYLFPTAIKAEGHSNALNEAMSQGLVPIVSNFHFNASIVGNEKFVVEGYNPKDYAERIVSFINSGEMANYSREVWERVKQLYAKSVVLHDVAEQIKNL